MIRLGLLGARGRMGKWIETLAEGEYSDRIKLSARISSGDAFDPLLKTDAVIDFSLPEAMEQLARRALKAKPTRLPVFVIGSTGWKPEQRKVLDKLSERTALVMASNFSTGVLALQEILKTAAPLLTRLGYTPALVETHHRHKKDAPSGTAISLQKIMDPKRPSRVQTHSIRAGEVIGDHEVTFYGPADHLTVGHFAQDRSVFARGALDVALWLASRAQSDHRFRGWIGIDQFVRERMILASESEDFVLE